MKEVKFKSMYDTFMSQVDPRRRQEITDSRMIQEDLNSMANLPGRVINRQFNQNRFQHNQNSAAAPENIFNDQVHGVHEKL